MEGQGGNTANLTKIVTDPILLVEGKYPYFSTSNNKKLLGESSGSCLAFLTLLI